MLEGSKETKEERVPSINTISSGRDDGNDDVDGDAADTICDVADEVIGSDRDERIDSWLDEIWVDGNDDSNADGMILKCSIVSSHAVNRLLFKSIMEWFNCSRRVNIDWFGIERSSEEGCTDEDDDNGDFEDVEDVDDEIGSVNEIEYSHWNRCNRLRNESVWYVVGANFCCL